MNWVDLLLAAVVLLGAWTGWRRGFVRAALFLVSMAVALVVAIGFYRYPAEWLQDAYPALNVWAAPAAFVIVWLGCQLLLDLFAHAIIAGLSRTVHANIVNRVLGMLPGAANGAIHFTPEGSSLTERLRQAKLPFVLAGENLALARTLAAAHQGLMDSPGHRANILRPQFGRVAVGVLDAGIHGLMITEDFRN